MEINMLDTDVVIPQMCEDKRCTRDDIVTAYAFAIKAMASEADEVDFKKINTAIMNRWSVSALEYIKRKAWKMCADKH